LFSTIEYQESTSIHGNNLKGLSDGMTFGGINIGFSLKNNIINVDGIGINVSSTMQGITSITDNDVNAGIGGIRVNRSDILKVLGNGVVTDGYGMRIDIVNKGALIDGNVIDTVGDTFYGDYSNRPEVTLGINLDI